MKHYLTEAVDALPIYRTPEKILGIIKQLSKQKYYICTSIKALVLPKKKHNSLFLNANVPDLLVKERHF